MGERGSASVELVIATPLLLLLILGVIQFALWEHATHIAQAVAQEGLAAGRVQGGSAASGQTEAEQVLDQLGPTVLASPTITAAQTGQTTTITVTGKAESVIGLFSLPVHATATGPTEAYRPPTATP